MFKLLDAHCDTFVRAQDDGADVFDNNLHISIKRLLEYDSPLQFFATCVARKEVADVYDWYRAAVEYYKENMEKYSEHIAPVLKYSDIEENAKAKKVSSLFTIEGAEVLKGNLDYLHAAYEDGVRCVTLVWNDNELAGNCNGNSRGGLTDTGKLFLKEMNKLGMIADVSHLSEKGFWDVHSLCEKPFVASHSNSYWVCPHPRNLTDDQLRALKEVNGVTGLNLCAPFLEVGGNPSMDDVVRHLERMLRLAGETGVGLGCDFDGISDPKFELTDVSKMTILHERCLKEFGAEITENMFYNNFLRIIKENLK